MQRNVLLVSRREGTSAMKTIVFAIIHIRKTLVFHVLQIPSIRIPSIQVIYIIMKNNNQTSAKSLKRSVLRLNVLRRVNPRATLRTGNVTCECDFNRGFCGKDPKTCKKWTGNVAELKKGIELSDDCEPRKCKLGLFKDKDGYGKCREHRECSNGEIIIANGTATTDTQCGFPNAFQSTTESTNISDVNSTDRNSSTPNVPSNRGNAGLVWIVIGVILGIIVIIVIVIIIYICWCRKQRGRDNHRNGFSANSGDLGQNEQKMSDMRETMIPNGGHAA